MGRCGKIRGGGSGSVSMRRSGKSKASNDIKITPNLMDFRTGEVGPKLDVRPDLKIYHRGCTNMINALPMIEGGVTRISGTKHLRTVRQVEDGWRLTITKHGNGGGLVRGTVGGVVTGIDCGVTCVYYYPHGTNVTLTATADTHSRFRGWSGHGFSGESPITVTMDGDKVIGARFVKRTRRIHQYTVGPSSTRWLRILDLDFNVEVDASLPINTASGRTGAIRMKEGKERAYVDGGNNIYLTADADASIPYRIRVHKMNMSTLTYSTLLVQVPDNHIAFNDGEVINPTGSAPKLYFSRWASMSANKVYVVDINSFTLESEFGANVVCPGNGIHVSLDYSRVYVLTYRYGPDYSQIVIFNLHTGAFVARVQGPGGSIGATEKSGMFKHHENLFYMSVSSSTDGSQSSARIVRADLPNITNISSVVMPGTLGTGLVFCQNPANGRIGYVLTRTHLVMVDLFSTPLSIMSSVEVAGSSKSMTIDEQYESIYITVYGSGNPPSRILVYDMWTFSLLAQYDRWDSLAMFLVGSG